MPAKGPIGIFYAAAFTGAVLAGFGDLLRGASNSPSVTVLRMSEVLRQYFSPSLGHGWVALLLLGVIGCALCLFYSPKTTKESFVLGMSVFAFMTASSPYKDVPTGQDGTAPKAQTTAFISLISPAFAQERSVIPAATSNLAKDVDYYFVLDAPDSLGPKRNVLFSLYNRDETQLLARQNVVIGSVVRFSMPKGSYVLLLECQGCGRVRVDVDFEGPIEASSIELPGSSVPLSLQRLFSASQIQARDLHGAEVQAVIERFNKANRVL